ncbi:hypothetical protein ACP70R_031416 [Stipagrostis hirtigluma subsp. patula]
MTQIEDGKTVMLWEDLWNGIIPKVTYPELHSYAKKSLGTVSEAKAMEDISDLFHLPLTQIAFLQIGELQVQLNNIHLTDQNDNWQYIWGTKLFSSAKAHKVMIGHSPVHPAFKWLWKCSCQMKHKVFFWLLMKDRLNTRGMLRRRNMELDSYVCEMCIWQREESLVHLFLLCPFAKLAWQKIGVLAPGTVNPAQAISSIKRQLNVPFFMEIIVIMAWAIWMTRNDWLFNNQDPTIGRCM